MVSYPYGNKIGISIKMLEKYGSDTDKFTHSEMKKWLNDREIYTPSISGYRGQVDIEAYTLYPDKKTVNKYIQYLITQFRNLSKQFNNELFIELEIHVKLF